MYICTVKPYEMKTERISLENIVIKSFIMTVKPSQMQTINGAALNTYITKVEGEKQGQFKGK